MSGSGFTNDVMHAENVDFSGGFPVAPQVTANGQLLIGSTVAPNIRVGTLASGDGSVTITNGAGTIDLSVAGGGAITSVSATNASIDFIQTGTVENINFGNTNLVLGSDIIGLTSGNNNVGMGLTALNNVTSGEQNVAIGTQSLQLLTTGSANTSIGRNSQASLSNGLLNTSTGQNSLFSNSSGSNNTAYGAGALQSYQGSNNTALGYLACRDTTGTGNLGLGYISLVNCSTGTNNTGIGNGTLQLITTGSSNIAVGLNAGSSLTLNDSNEILIGTNQSAVAGESNTIRIGVTQTRAFMAGIAGVSVSNQQTVVIDSTTGQLGSISGSPIVVIRTSNIDLTTMGATLLFTPTSEFLITDINFYGVSLTGTITGAGVDFGWTGPTYSDFDTNKPILLQLTGTYANFTANAGLGVNQHLVIPASTGFYINVTTADPTAITNTQRIDIIGYFL